MMFPALSKPIARFVDVKPKKLLKFDAKVFEPKNASSGAMSTSIPLTVPSSTVQFSSTPAVLTSASVLMKLTKMVLDKFTGDPLEGTE